ncbi:hypothetical protein CDV31_003678 [Fusarium ambrosium]|uniref:D-isomer specific 2-hydroxyacid dehydrogenase NAD-binding domain-containing protein n=1 Tax=Fusarium ambrosium TaxID=131363 RepID=A0A428UT20_9HYPO|nr:hypothetical protein CDV31_003678 [Fusarium ambrosium]
MTKTTPKKDVLLVFIPVDPDIQWVNRINSTLPHIEVRWVKALSDGRLLTPIDISPNEWDGVTMVCTYFPPPPSLAPRLRFVQVSSAGFDLWVDHPSFQDPDVVICSANGAHPPQIAEWVIGTWIMNQRQFLEHARNMETQRWKTCYEHKATDSAGSRMGILGYGCIGRQCARVASAMGMEVYAFTRTERPTPESRKDSSYCVPGTGDPDGLIPAKWFHGSSRADVDTFLDQKLDILVVCLPLTQETSGIISGPQFKILSKNRTFLSNVGRGKHVDTNALTEVLQSGQIRGAALDVTDPEPLPSDHPLWKAPNVFITPHNSWHSTMYWPRVLEILGTNLERLDTGGPLVNAVKKSSHSR